MEFWNNILTEQSWNVLLELNKKPIKFVLIGGWAAYLWTKQHKSKDIDIALINIKELDYLKKHFDLKKNDRLKKYEIKQGEIDVDIYVPYYSKLPIPTEELEKHSTKIEGITVAKPEALLILKQGAEIERKDTIKGLKDRIDIMSILLHTQTDFRKYLELAEKYGLQGYESRLKQIIAEFAEIKYLGMNPRQLKLRKKELMEKLSSSHF